MKYLKKTSWFLPFLAFLLLISCGKEQEQKTVRLAYVNWAEGVAMSNVVKAVLDEKGYKVRLMYADVAPIFATISKGRADVFMDTWMPATHKEYMNKYGDDLDVIGENFDDARIGLVVPEYVSINSIEELNEHADQFNDEIIGIDAGAGIMRATEEAIPEYDLQLNLKTASESAMTASLKKAIDKNEWIVVTGWTPHWKFSRWELKMLKDPKKTYGDAEKILTVARKGFKEEKPLVAEFFGNISFTNEQISELMEVMENHTNEQVAAKAWIEDNQDLIEKWLPDELK